MSYIQQYSNLPTDVQNYSKDSCQVGCNPRSGSYNIYNCQDHCSTGCNKFLSPNGTPVDNYRDPALNDKTLCCHYTDNTGSIDHTCCGGDWCAQTQNMNMCFVVSDNEPCTSGRKQICGRACNQRCSADALDSYLENAPQFQIKDCQRYKGDKSNDSCKSLGTTVVPWQICMYNTNDFKTKEHVERFTTAHGSSGPNYDEIMTNFCSTQVSGNCPRDPLDSTQTTAPEHCAQYFQASQNGTFCRDWIAKKDPGLRNNYLDAVGSRYCGKYNTNECKCINRSRSLQYQELKGSAPWNDGCWFSPCNSAYASNYFQPVSVNVQLNPSMCPSNYCATILNASGYNETYIKDNEQYINCDNRG